MISALPKSTMILSLPRAAAGFVVSSPLTHRAYSNIDLQEAATLQYDFQFDFSLGMAADPASSLTISQLSQLSQRTVDTECATDAGGCSQLAGARRLAHAQHQREI